MQLGRTYDLDAALKVGNISEAVQVTAENAPLVDTRSTMIAHNVTAEEIDRMPKGRSFQSIALTAPSVNSGEIEGGFQVNGASGAENAFTVDGVITNSLVNGSSRQNTVFEYIQEVQVKTTGIPAEFGGALGGVISAVTKSGGNIFTGEGHYYFDGSPLSAGPVKRLVLSPIDDKTVSYVQDDEAAGHPPRVRRIDRRPDRPRQTVLLRIVLTARQHARRTTTCSRSAPSRATSSGRPKLMQAFGKVSVGSRRVNAYVHVARDADLRQRHAAGLQRHRRRTSCPASRLRTSRTSSAAGSRCRSNINGNVDVVISNGAYATFRGGYFHDRYTDTGIPHDDELHLSDGRTSNCVRLRVPANLQGPTEHAEHAACADHGLRHDQAQARSTPTTTTRSRAAAGTR